MPAPPPKELFAPGTGPPSSWVHNVPRQVLVAGQMRSGSTLVYLAARELLTVVQQSLFGAAANPVAFQHRHHAHQLLGVCDNAERCVLKTHNFAPGSRST